MDILSNSRFEKMFLSRNPIEINVPVLQGLSIENRSAIRYYLEIYLPEYFRANDFVKRAIQEGSEEPAYQIGTSSIYPGATFTIEEILDSLLENKRPEFSQKKITVCENATSAFYTKYIRTFEATSESAESGIEYVLKAGIDERYFSEWKEIFFTDFLNRKFLTLQGPEKKVRPESPEFLYWLSNITPVPTLLRLRVQIRYEDNTTETVTAQELAGVTQYTMYCVPVGPIALGLGEKEKVVTEYIVWLSNQDNERLTEMRTYKLDYDYKRNVRHLIFQNSLGGYDTLCLYGRGSENLTIERQLFTREKIYYHEPTYAERIINRIVGRRELTVNTGWFDSSSYSIFEDLMLSKDVLIVTDRNFLPLTATSQSISSNVDDEKLIGRELVFQYANEQKNVGNLPIAPAKGIRQTGWRAYSSACQLNEFGIQTGFSEVKLLEKYYLDNNAPVIPSQIKANTPDTEGYLINVPSSLCSPDKTKYFSAAINRLGTYSRQCPEGYTGTKAMIHIPEGKFGSNRSQAEADARAEAEYSKINTLAYANNPANGAVCNLTSTDWMPEEQVENGSFAYRWKDKSNENSGANVYCYNGYTSNNIGDILAIVYAMGNVILEPYDIALSRVYPFNSNDVFFPYNTAPNRYNVLIYSSGAGKRVKIWVNGVLRSNIVYDYSSFVQGWLTVLLPSDIPNKARVYVETENSDGSTGGITFSITNVEILKTTTITATVVVSNPNEKALEYSKDDVVYQTSNVFTGLMSTNYFFARDADDTSQKVLFQKIDTVTSQADSFEVPSIAFAPPAMLNQVDYTGIPDFDMPRYPNGKYKFMTLLVGPNFRAQATAANVMKKGFTMIDWGVMVVGTERQNPTYDPHTYDINFVSSLAPAERTINITLGPELYLNGYGSTGELINSVDYSLYSSSITGNLQGNISKFFDGSKTYTDVGVVFLDIEVAGLNDLTIQDFVNRIIAIYEVIKAGVGTNTLVCLHYQSLPHPHVGLGISEASYTQAPDPMWTTPASMTPNAIAKNFPSVLVGKRLQDLDYLLGVVEFYPLFEMFQPEGYVMMNLLNQPLKDSSGNDISILTHFDVTNRSFLHFATHLNAILEINKKDIGNRPILLQTSIFNQGRGGYWYADGTDEMIIKQRYDEYVYAVPSNIVEAIELNTLFMGCWYYPWMDTNIITPVDRSEGEIHTSTEQRRDFSGMTAIAAGMRRLAAYKGIIDGVEYSVADLIDGTQIYTDMLTQVNYLTVSGFSGLQTVKGTDFQKHKIPVVRCIVNEAKGLIAILYYMPYGVELSTQADVYYNSVFQYKLNFEVGKNKVHVGKLRI